MAYRCVVFDFDGTLADTEDVVFNLYNKMAEKYKYSTIDHDELLAIKDLHFSEILKIVDIPFYRLPRVLKDGQKRMKIEMENIKAFTPEIVAFTEALRKETEIQGILTSNTEKNVRAFMVNYGLENAFDFVISSALLSKQKKLRRVLKKYAMEKEELLYVGDELRDVESCKIAGVDVAAVTWGYNSRSALINSEPTYIVDSLSEILEIVRDKKA